MEVQLFSIRVDEKFTQIDQNSLNDFLETVNFKKSDVHFVETEPSFWSVLVQFEEKIDTVSKLQVLTEPRHNFQKENAALNSCQQAIFDSLKTWRQNKANELGYPAYVVCHNSHLVDIATSKPKSVSELSQIKGFGENKANRFGIEIIELLSAS